MHDPLRTLSPEDLAAYLDAETRNPRTREVRDKVEAAFRQAYPDQRNVLRPNTSTEHRLRLGTITAKVAEDARRAGYDVNKEEQVEAAYRSIGLGRALDLAAQLEAYKAHPAYLDRWHTDHKGVVQHVTTLFEALAAERERYLGSVE